jgi:hypothetical protein
VYTARGIYTAKLTVTDNNGGTGSDTLIVRIRARTPTITFNFVDQYGNLVGTGNERIYVDNYGWMANGGQITVPVDTTIHYRLYYSQGSALYGAQLSYLCYDTDTLNVEWRTLAMDFEDQDGDLNPAAGRGTGNERVYINYITNAMAGTGWKANAQTVTLPPNITIQCQAWFAQGTIYMMQLVGLHGPTYSVNSGNIGDPSNLVVMYHTLTMDFRDQNGALTPTGYGGTGNERVNIDWVGYKANAQTTTVPLNCAISCQAYFSQGSAYKGPTYPVNVDGSFTNLTVMYDTITLRFQDQNGDLNPAAGIGTGNERVYINYITSASAGWKANGDAITVPVNTTLSYSAWYAQGTISYLQLVGLYGPTYSVSVTGSLNELVVQYRTITFDIVDLAGNPVSGAQVQVDYVGYVANGGSIVVPAGSTPYHKANVGTVWSVKTGEAVDGTWTTCTYVWTGSVFNSPSYT